MIVYSIHVFKIVGGEGGKSALLMAEAYELSSFGFFSRDTAREVLRFGNRQVATFAQPGQREVVRLKNGASCHYGVGARGFACTVSTDSECAAFFLFLDESSHFTLTHLPPRVSFLSLFHCTHTHSP